jgi:hypothetical protein
MAEDPAKRRLNPDVPTGDHDDLERTGGIPCGFLGSNCGETR